MVNFIVEFTLSENENMQAMSTLWKVHTNGSSIQKIGGVGVIVTSPKGDILFYGVQLQFPTANNKAKYEAILTGLKVARSLKARSVLLKSDSKLRIGQINREYEVKESKMQ